MAASLKQIEDSFNEVTAGFAKESERVRTLIAQRSNRPMTINKVAQAEEMGAKCYAHITTSMDDARYWMKRLADWLEIN